MRRKIKKLKARECDDNNTSKVIVDDAKRAAGI